jgi:hypothetical protein
MNPFSILILYLKYILILSSNLHRDLLWVLLPLSLLNKTVILLGGGGGIMEWLLIK